MGPDLRSLAEVARMAGARLWSRVADSGAGEVATRRVTGAEIDSRTLAPGQVFVALSGEHADGHAFVRGALEQGAPAALVAREWSEAHASELPAGAALLVVESPEVGLQAWAREYRGAFSCPLGAVAGSNGKTTTRVMLERALSPLGDVLGTRGNRNNHLGVPLTLLCWEPEHRAASVELGMNHAGELRFLCELARPTHGVIVNVGKEHLEGLGSLAAVARAESELADFLESTGGVTVLNADDAVLMSANQARSNPVRTFGLEPGADVRAVDLEPRGLEGTRFKIFSGPPINLRLAGVHNVYNALAALTLAGEMGVSQDAAARALETLEASEHGRLEHREVAGVVLLDDTYNANPNSLAAAVALVRALPAKGRRLLLLADMLELGEGAAREHEESGRALTGVDAVWAAGQFAGNLVHGAREAGVADVEAFDEVMDLAKAAGERVRAGDVVLVKGSRGMRMERVVEAIERRGA